MKKAVFYIVLAGILWGTSGIFVHYLAPYGFSSYQMTSVRAFVSFLCIAAYALIKDKNLFLVRLVHLPLLLGVGASLFATASLYYSAMQLSSVSTAVVLMFTAPIYVMVFSIVFLKEKMTVTKAVGTACMLIGCALVSGVVGGFRFSTAGLILGILSGITYAAYNILTKISLQLGVKPVSVTLYSFMFVFVISLIFLDPKSLAGSVSASPEFTLPMLLGLGIFTFVTPYFLYTLAMRDLPAGTASALGIIEPMAATLFSVTIFGERLTLLSGIGIVLILSAVFIIGKAEGNKNNTSENPE
ncbi:MAG: EamA family transporter [Clostridia bacterium]|nr:EamA family transporter [Clostridia bacterium]